MENWGSFSANYKRCYRLDCTTPKTGTLVTFQSFRGIQIREIVVLTSECMAANNKPCIFPAKLRTASSQIPNHGYMPACFEKSTNEFVCATDVKYNTYGKILEATELSTCKPGCIGVIPSINRINLKIN